MTDDSDVAICWHEAGHSTAAFVLGRRPDKVAVFAPVGEDAAESYHRGCAWSTPRRIPRADLERVEFTDPLPMWPASVRRKVETDVMVLAAGQLSAWMRPARPARRPPPLAERFEQLPRPTRRETAEIAEAETDIGSGPTDDERIAEVASLVFDDLRPVAAWLTFLERSTAVMLEFHRRRVAAVADALLEHRTLGAAAVRTILENTPRLGTGPGLTKG